MPISETVGAVLVLQKTLLAPVIAPPFRYTPQTYGVLGQLPLPNVIPEPPLVALIDFGVPAFKYIGVVAPPIVVVPNLVAVSALPVTLPIKLPLKTGAEIIPSSNLIATASLTYAL